MDITALHFPCGRICKLMCLLSILQHARQIADSLPFVFPVGMLKLRFVVSSGLQIQTDLLLHRLTSHLPKFILYTANGVCTMNWPHSLGCVGGGEQSSRGVHGPVWGNHR